MSENKAAKVMRVVAIVFLSLSAVWTFLSGVGTSCVAFGAENYDSMAGIIPYKGLYQGFVFVTAAIGLALAVATRAFAKGRPWAYWGSIILLAVDAAVGWYHYTTSVNLRGSGAPANTRVYLALLTLVILLLLRIPSIWRGLPWGGNTQQKADGGAAGGGVALIVMGLGTIGAPIAFTSTHVLGGINWAHAFDLPLMIGGGIMVTAGLFLLLRREQAEKIIAADAVTMP